MVSIFSNIQGLTKMDSPPKSSIWTWVVPVIISIVVTFAGVMITTGGAMQRLEQVEKKGDKIDTKLDRIDETLKNVASKDDLRELKSDMKDRFKDKK